MDVQLNTKNTEYATTTISSEYAVFKYDDNALYLVRKGSSTNRCTCQQVYITYDMIPPTPPE